MADSFESWLCLGQQRELPKMAETNSWEDWGTTSSKEIEKWKIERQIIERIETTERKNSNGTDEERTNYYIIGRVRELSNWSSSPEWVDMDEWNDKLLVPPIEIAWNDTPVYVWSDSPAFWALNPPRPACPFARTVASDLLLFTWLATSDFVVIWVFENFNKQTFVQSWLFYNQSIRLKSTRRRTDRSDVAIRLDHMGIHSGLSDRFSALNEHRQTYLGGGILYPAAAEGYLYSEYSWIAWELLTSMQSDWWSAATSCVFGQHLREDAEVNTMLSNVWHLRQLQQLLKSHQWIQRQQRRQSTKTPDSLRRWDSDVTVSWSDIQAVEIRISDFAAITLTVLRKTKAWSTADDRDFGKKIETE